LERTVSTGNGSSKAAGLVNLSLPKLPNQILMVQVQVSPVSYLYMDRFSEFAVRHLRRKGDRTLPKPVVAASREAA
jgi:hypothetical protein